MRKTLILTVAATLTLGLITGCPPQPAPPPSGKTDFDAFVKKLIDETAENTQPTPIENLDFTFDDDPAAFDDLFK